MDYYTSHKIKFIHRIKLLISFSVNENTRAIKDLVIYDIIIVLYFIGCVSLSTHRPVPTSGPRSTI